MHLVWLSPPPSPIRRVISAWGLSLKWMCSYKWEELVLSALLMRVFQYFLGSFILLAFRSLVKKYHHRVDPLPKASVIFFFFFHHVKQHLHDVHISRKMTWLDYWVWKLFKRTQAERGVRVGVKEADEWKKGKFKGEEGKRNVWGNDVTYCRFVFAPIEMQPPWILWKSRCEEFAEGKPVC